MSFGYWQDVLNKADLWNKTERTRAVENVKLKEKHQPSSQAGMVHIKYPHSTPIEDHALWILPQHRTEVMLLSEKAYRMSRALSCVSHGGTLHRSSEWV